MRKMLFVLLGFIFLNGCSIQKVTLEEKKFAYVLNESGIDLHYKADLNSKSAKHVKKGSLITIIQETKNAVSVPELGSAKLYKAQTRTGVSGWTFGKYINFIDEQASNRRVLDEIGKLSINLQTQVIDSVNAYEKKDDNRQFTKIQYSEIESVLGTETLGTLKCVVKTYLKGSILGIDKFKVTYNIIVELSDIDNLGSVEIKIININRGLDIKIESIPDQINTNILASELVSIFGYDKLQMNQSE